MSIFLLGYDEKSVIKYYDKQLKKSFSYKPIFLTKNTKNKVKGFDYDAIRVKLGTGKKVFEIGKQAIMQWEMFPKKWIKLYPTKPTVGIGETVAVTAKYLGLWWVNITRIAYVINDMEIFGFAYGTLPGHMEKGEELFQIRMDEKENVYFELIAISKPNTLIAKISYNMMRSLQKKFREEAANAVYEYVRIRK